MNHRIEKISELVSRDKVVADIGSDHGQLPVLLVRNGMTQKAYACDVAEGPLNSAIENIRKNHLENHITAILSNGLENVPEDTQSIVIAGMGYYTAEMILTQAFKRLCQLDEIIVQVNGDVDRMRSWIQQNGFLILDEIYVEDKGFPYIAIKFTPKEKGNMSDDEIILGPVLMKKKDPDWIAFLEKRMDAINRIMNVKPDTDPSFAAMKREYEAIASYLKQGF